jgi:hypothetical protein
MSRHSLDLTAGANARCSPHSYRWMASLPATSPSPQRSDGAMPCLAAPCTGCCSRLPFAAMAPSHRAQHPANILLRRGSADVLTAMLGQMYIIFHATAAWGVRQTLPCRPALQQCLVCLVSSVHPSIHPSITYIQSSTATCSNIYPRTYFPPPLPLQLLVYISAHSPLQLQLHPHPTPHRLCFDALALALRIRASYYCRRLGLGT